MKPNGLQQQHSNTHRKLVSGTCGYQWEKDGLSQKIFLINHVKMELYEVPEENMEKQFQLFLFGAHLLKLGAG